MIEEGKIYTNKELRDLIKETGAKVGADIAREFDKFAKEKGVDDMQSSMSILSMILTNATYLGKLLDALFGKEEK